MSALHELLIKSAEAEGFPLAGTVDLALAQEDLRRHAGRYDQWIGAGFAGAMDYLVRGRDRRADPRVVFPEAKSMFCVAIPYGSRAAAGAPDPAQGPRYARYIRGRDYHHDVAERLERAMTRANVEWIAKGNAPLKWKVCVDTSAVLERSWAALAGLGWIGKNTMLIHPKLGSYLFLAEALIDQETGHGPAPIADLCGHCTKCLSSCPTQAFVEPRSLDSRKCISYLTLEKRGAYEASSEVRAKMGTWIAGCDVCQEVCPFNFKPARDDLRAADDGATSAAEWLTLLDESEDHYKERVSTSSLKRVKPAQFRRNLASSLANAAREGSLRPDTSLTARIRAKLEAETDEAAREEWSRCVQALEGAPSA